MSCVFQTWDNEIAMIAQKWASNCKWGHDDNKDRKTLGKLFSYSS